MAQAFGGHLGYAWAPRLGYVRSRSRRWPHLITQAPGYRRPETEFEQSLPLLSIRSPRYLCVLEPFEISQSSRISDIALQITC